VPVAPGTWPAFWVLPSDNLVVPQPVVAEVDAIELYGHDPTSACNSTHDYRDGEDGGVADCGPRFATTRSALSWHTYGVSITPVEITFYVDGMVVSTAPQVGGGRAPMFFLVNLALGGGWPVDLTGTQNRARLYVDYVRVYV
jgi:beta-glucanase (GH16 family)